jgi:chemotaxis protein methyltransferase CheR
MELSAEDFRYLASQVRQVSGLVLEPEQCSLVETRLEPLLRAEGLASPVQLLSRLRTRPPGSPLHRRLAEALANHETTFFRDPPFFEDLRTTVLPGLMARRAASRELRFWCAACAYGQEPYSLAMLLAEAGLWITGWSLRILATDFSSAALERAREGRYGPTEVARGLSPALCGRYFHAEPGGWVLHTYLRERVEFRQLNLLEDFSLPPMDVIFLRNVMIYWDVPTRQAVLARIRRVLRADGYLVLGAAETTYHLDESFERVNLGHSSWFRLRPQAQLQAG